MAWINVDITILEIIIVSSLPITTKCFYEEMGQCKTLVTRNYTCISFPPHSSYVIHVISIIDKLI